MDCVDQVTGGAVPTFPLHSTHVWVWGEEHSGSDELLPETRRPSVGDHYRLLSLDYLIGCGLQDFSVSHSLLWVNLGF